MQHRVLGELTVSALGLGCMGMSEFYGASSEQDNIDVIHRALELGVSFLDTADMYGPFTNEELVGKAIAGHRDTVTLASKFGNERGRDGSFRGVNGRPEYVRACIDGSLQRLGVDHLDLWYQHRVDPKVPVEETWGVMSEQVEAGKVRYLGISEAAPESIRAAHAVHPVTALQTEYSLWSRDPEDLGILDTVRELGIGFVAYSPLGRGFLTGAITSPAELDADDYRAHSPRFQGDNFARNLELVAAVRRFADDMDATPAQVALAWVLSRGDDMVPIPGTTSVDHLDDNVIALELTLSDEEIGELDGIAPVGAAAGDRYADMSSVNR